MNKSCCSLHPAWMKTTAVFLTAMKLFLSQWNFYGHAETIPRSKVSAWLFVWITKGVRHGEKYLHKDHNETNPKMEKAENPCPARIFGKRKSSIVSDTLVSKLSNLFGPSGETRTPGVLIPKYRQNLYIVYSVFLGRFSLIRLLSSNFFSTQFFYFRHISGQISGHKSALPSKRNRSSTEKIASK